MKSNAKKICLIVAIVFIALFVGSTFLQSHNNRKKAEEACSLIMDQLEDVMEENEANINTLMATLKEEYVVRAEMVAFMLGQHEERELSAEEYQRMAKNSKVDEIHLFDETGEIIAGSNPEYYGYNFDSGEQMAYFKPMLSDHSLEMCQDVTQNTAEGKSMMYAIVWSTCGKHMVQIGISPDRLLEKMASSDIRTLIDQIPVTEGVDIFLVDTEKEIIVGSTEKNMIGKESEKGNLRDIELKEAKKEYTTATVSGEDYYVGYEQLGDYVVAVTYAKKSANAGLSVMMLIMGSTFFLSFCLIAVIVTRAFREMERSLEKVEQANQAKSQFLSRMSHDIRTPLNGILGLIEIDKKHADDRELVDSNREKAKVAADHLMSLLSDVLELSKMEEESVQLAHEPFDILQLAAEVLALTEFRASEKGITLQHTDCKADHVYPYVYGSPLHVKRVILNILGNAIKYNKPNGSIQCSMQMIGKDEKTVVYQAVISDTGIGMRPEFLEHIFEPFSQEHSDARSTYYGTGLGMAIVKSLLDKMDGTIRVESKEGEGSRFTVTIPFEIASEEEMPQKAERTDIDLSGIRILLVEDNALNREIASMLLKDAGVTVTEAQDGLEAVNLFVSEDAGTFDLILMDLMMPVMDGYEALKKIRASGKADAKSVPIVAMTANAFVEDVQKCMEAGMNGHLSKPIELEKLMDLLVSLVEKKAK